MNESWSQLSKWYLQVNNQLYKRTSTIPIPAGAQVFVIAPNGIKLHPSCWYLFQELK